SGSSGPGLGWKNCSRRCVRIGSAPSVSEGDRRVRPTEDLLRLVDQEGIELRWASLAPYWYGLYVREASRPPYILRDHSLENRQVPFRAVLAEALGHHFTTEGSWVRRASSRNTVVLQPKVELRALRWAIDYMLHGHML